MYMDTRIRIASQYDEDNVLGRLGKSKRAKAIQREIYTTRVPPVFRASLME